MKILIACECSGIIREAFKAKGHDAWSCDIKETKIPGKHIQDDVLNHLQGWDMIIAHPECKYLCFSGERWVTPGTNGYQPGRMRMRLSAFSFFSKIANAPCEKICIENSHSIFLLKYFTNENFKHQHIQPWQHGEPFKKRTDLWLKGLPFIQPGDIMEERKNACHFAKPGDDRSERRAITYPGIAKSFAEQWNF